MENNNLESKMECAFCRCNEYGVSEDKKLTYNVSYMIHCDESDATKINVEVCDDVLSKLVELFDLHRVKYYSSIGWVSPLRNNMIMTTISDTATCVLVDCVSCEYDQDVYAYKRDEFDNKIEQSVPVCLFNNNSPQFNFVANTLKKKLGWTHVISVKLAQKDNFDTIEFNQTRYDNTFANKQLIYGFTFQEQCKRAYHTNETDGSCLEPNHKTLYLIVRGHCE